MLLLEPRRADPADGPAAGDDVERGDDLGQHGRVPVGHPGHERAQVGGGGAGAERAEGGVSLQHLQLRRAQHGQLPEVVHHPDGVEAGLLGGDGLVHHPAEEALRCDVGVGEQGDLVAGLDEVTHGGTPSVGGTRDCRCGVGRVGSVRGPATRRCRPGRRRRSGRGTPTGRSRRGRRSDGVQGPAGQPSEMRVTSPSRRLRSGMRFSTSPVTLPLRRRRRRGPSPGPW